MRPIKTEQRYNMNSILFPTTYIRMFCVLSYTGRETVTVKICYTCFLKCGGDNRGIQQRALYIKKRIAIQQGTNHYGVEAAGASGGSCDVYPCLYTHPRKQSPRFVTRPSVVPKVQKKHAKRATTYRCGVHVKACYSLLGVIPPYIRNFTVQLDNV